MPKCHHHVVLTTILSIHEPLSPTKTQNKHLEPTTLEYHCKPFLQCAVCWDTFNHQYHKDQGLDNKLMQSFHDEEDPSFLNEDAGSDFPKDPKNQIEQDLQEMWSMESTRLVELGGGTLELMRRIREFNLACVQDVVVIEDIGRVRLFR